MGAATKGNPQDQELLLINAIYLSPLSIQTQTFNL